MPKSKSIFLELKFTKKINNTVKLFEKYIDKDFRNIPQMLPHEYVKYCYNKYVTGTGASVASQNGNFFELIIATCLFREDIKPMFLQAKVTFVPNVTFDILLYSDEQYPIALSLKTSTRERYKQADLEAVALKYVHRRSLNYLIVLDSKETKVLKDKLKNGELLGIDNIIEADTEEFDELIANLKNNKYINPGKVDIIKGNIVE